MPRSSFRRRPIGAAVVVAVALLAAGCGGGSNNQSGSGTLSGSSAKPVQQQSQDAALHAKLPAKLTSAGIVKVATDASYAPNEFFASDNKTIIGMDPDLGKALGQVLGIKFQFVNVSFDSIIPSLGSRYDLGMSSFTDTAVRQKTVDMVTYFKAGTSFLVKKGTNTNVTGLASLCGLSVGVEKGTTQLADATAQSKKCTSAGKSAVKVLAFPDQNGANLALQSGRVAVVMGDSPVIAYAAKQSNGQFTTVGQSYGTAPYGIAVPKSSGYAGFATAIQGALRRLMSNGTYQSILTKWGIQGGAISNPQINPAH